MKSFETPRSFSVRATSLPPWTGPPGGVAPSACSVSLRAWPVVDMSTAYEAALKHVVHPATKGVWGSGGDSEAHARR